MILTPETAAPVVARESRRRASPIPVMPILLFAAVLVLTYGYEVFSFGLTLDEELYGELDNGEYAVKWVEQGRWAMSLLTLAVPSPVVPVVSAGLGVGLSGVGWWLLSRGHLGLGPWQSAAVCSVAATIPVLAFMYSFSTIALGIGVGTLLLVTYAWGVSARSWTYRGLGMFAGATAIGIYDSFLVAMVALALGFLFARPKLFTALLGFGSAVVALVVSRLFAWVANAVTNVPPGAYISHFLNWEALSEDPGALLAEAQLNTAEVLFLSEVRFGLHSPWLAVVIIFLSLLALYSALRPDAPASERALRCVAVVGLVLLPYATTVAAPLMPLRSMLYLPIITLVLAGAALKGTRYFPRDLRRVAAPVAAVLIALAVIGNATISNRLFASAQTAYALDQQMAFQIGLEKDKLHGGDQMVDLPMVISGPHPVPESRLRPERETLGTSFFDWDNRTKRAGAFLRAHGVKVHDPSPEQVAQARTVFATMPPYPLDGWVRVDNGVLLVKFR